MKAQMLLFILLLAGISVSAQKSGKKVSFIELTEALRQKLITAEIRAKGGHQGESLVLVCKSLTGKQLRIQVRQGQLMEPSDSIFQTLVIATEAIAGVGPKTPVEIPLQTFCTQAGDASPAGGAAFAVGTLAADRLCQLLRFISDKGKADLSDAQMAVWCVTDNKQLGGIGDRALQIFTAELLGKKPPVHRIYYEVHERPGEPAFSGKALKIEGTYQYVLEKDALLSILLLDSDGKTVKVLRKNDLNKAGEHRSGLQLEVYNLPPGKYTLRIQKKNGEVIKDFEVEF